MNFIERFLAAIVCAVVLAACHDDTGLAPNEAFEFKVPENFPEPTYTFKNNPVSREGFELGKKLFFDPVLSRDQTIACSSCHAQSVAFADPQHRLSIGIEDRIGKRNAPQIANLAFQSSFFWDGGVTHVDFIPVNAIENELEMDNDISVILARLRADEDYKDRFEAVFGGDTINSGRLLHTLSQFMVMLVSADSRYDKHVRNEGETLTKEELEGRVIFENKCSNCHSGTLFTNGGFANNGLESDFSRDTGRAIITERTDDIGKFKIPSLRNVALTSPYMHDGRFETLEEVLEHYSDGVVDSPTLASELRKDDGFGIALSDVEQQKIIAFLNTLTDNEFIIDERFRRNN
ncbi:cytochrome-c peroxidase [Fulvivirga sp. M361]|uniref:cytochrome-c peroxidase n=1 Tax=Fulvivirga sp. M361 TaxID=2594266 RepID=UPI00117B2D05|nr:cytochrome c peroxidase [Fulvivirga sp. M361]TRX58814.1 cytochrome-c peroxidase [Fulvivirga sp. M361]